MNERKSSVEGKVGRKGRPTASNLREGEARLGSWNLEPERSNKGTEPEPERIESRKPVELAPIPKTRFTCADLSGEARRSASLPRFKNFPPEQIRKSPRPICPTNDPSPVQQLDPERDQTFFVANQSENYGQGDAETTGRVVQQQVNPGEVNERAERPTGNKPESNGGGTACCFRGRNTESVPPKNTATNDPAKTQSCSPGPVPVHIPPGRMFSCPNYQCYRKIEPRSSLQHHREMQQRANNQRIIMNGQQYFYNSNVPERSSESHCCSRVLSSPEDYNATVYPRQTGPPFVSPNTSNWAEFADERLGKSCETTAPTNHGDCQIGRAKPGEAPRSDNFHRTRVGAHREQDCAQKLMNQGARRKLEPEAEPEAESRKEQPARRRVFQFTADMIRDQEALVYAMRQQAVPEDTMKRQFDTLLNEQRKYLAFLEQIRQDIPEVKTCEPSGNKRAKDPQGEKPEWMIHITPPRPSYVLRSYQPNHRSSEGQKSNRNQDDQPVYHNSREHSRGYDQHQEIPGVQEYARLPSNTVPRFNQQQVQAPPAGYNGNQHPACVHSGIAGPSCPGGHQYPHQHHFPPVVQGPCKNESVNFGRQFESQVQPKPGGNSTGLDPGAGENPERPVEPCSLLKMKVYKEVIRPQSRNNGLQDIETVSLKLHQEKGRKAKDRLEDRETEKRRAARLNGIQDPEQSDSQVEQRVEQRVAPVETPKRISANGLENSRNPNNPPQSRFARMSTSNPEVVTEYPVQKKIKRGFHDAAAGHPPRETIQRTESSGNYPASPDTEPPSRFMGNGFLGGGDVNSPQEKTDRQDPVNLNCTGDTAEVLSRNRHQTRNKVTFQPEIQEARIIGGITYLARKPSYIPGMRNATPEPRFSATH